MWLTPTQKSREKLLQSRVQKTAFLSLFSLMNGSRCCLMWCTFVILRNRLDLFLRPVTFELYVFIGNILPFALAFFLSLFNLFTHRWLRTRENPVHTLSVLTFARDRILVVISTKETEEISSWNSNDGYGDRVTSPTLRMWFQVNSTTLFFEL